MAETTYNVTLPHTSTELYYYSGSSDWYVNCPLTNGVPICGDDGGNFNGYHFSNSSTAKFDVKFYGKSLYIWGAADQGMTVTIQINSFGSPYTLSPSGGMLASIDDFTTLCGSSNVYSCSDFSARNDGSGYNYNTATIVATQYVVGATVQISKAVFKYGTHLTGASTTLKTYQSTDTNIKYSTGWIKNGTYMQSGDSSTTIQDAKTFTMTFDGPAIWVWEFCGQRNAGLDFGDYGTLTINGNVDYASQSLADNQPIPQDGKCLAFFKGNLYDTGNSLSFSSDIYNCQIHSIDVLQISGGTPISTTTSNYLGPSLLPSYTSTPTGGTKGVSKGVLVAVPVVIISLAVVAGVVAAFLIRKARKRKAAMIPGYTVGNPPLTTPETKQPETAFNIPAHPSYLMYSPPPPATPAAPALHAPST